MSPVKNTARISCGAPSFLWTTVWHCMGVWGGLRKNERRYSLRYGTKRRIAWTRLKNPSFGLWPPSTENTYPMRTMAATKASSSFLARVILAQKVPLFVKFSWTIIECSFPTTKRKHVDMYLRNHHQRSALLPTQESCLYTLNLAVLSTRVCLKISIFIEHIHHHSSFGFQTIGRQSARNSDDTP